MIPNRNKEQTWGQYRKMFVQEYRISHGDFPEPSMKVGELTFAEIMAMPEDQPVSDLTLPEDMFETDPDDNNENGEES